MSRFHYSLTYRLRRGSLRQVEHLKSLAGRRQLFPSEVCTPKFLTRHTRFANYAELKSAAGLPDVQDDLSSWDTEDLSRLWDIFVAYQTPFPNCKSLLSQAVHDWGMAQLDPNTTTTTKPPSPQANARELITDALIDSPAPPVEDEEPDAPELTRLEDFSGDITPIPLQEIPQSLMVRLIGLGHAEELFPKYAPEELPWFKPSFPRVAILELDTRKLVYRSTMVINRVNPNKRDGLMIPGPWKFQGAASADIHSQVLADKYVFDPILLGRQESSQLAMEIAISLVPFGAAMQAFHDHGVTSIEGWINLGADIGSTVLVPGGKAVAVGAKALARGSKVARAVNVARNINILHLFVNNPKVLNGIRITGLVLANGDLAFQGVVLAQAGGIPGNPAAAIAAGGQFLIFMANVKKMRRGGTNQTPVTSKQLLADLEKAQKSSQIAYAKTKKSLLERAKKALSDRRKSEVKTSRDPLWISTNEKATKANADILRRNLGGKANDELAAHHIVPSTDKRAAPIRTLLEEYQIDINSVDNGVLLPQSFHQQGQLHNDVVIGLIHERLASKTRGGTKGKNLWANKRAALVTELNSIAKEIVHGEFP